VPPPLKFGKIFLGQLLCKIRTFSGKKHVKYGNFVNFSGKNNVKFGHFADFNTYIFRAKILCPLPPKVD